VANGDANCQTNGTQTVGFRSRENSEVGRPNPLLRAVSLSPEKDGPVHCVRTGCRALWLLLGWGDPQACMTCGLGRVEWTSQSDFGYSMRLVLILGGHLNEMSKPKVRTCVIDNMN
jgi:hypothetical protein